MYSLLLVACFSASLCEYEITPVVYDDHARCVQQSHILAGMMRANYPPGTGMVYSVRCVEQEIEQAALEEKQVKPALAVKETE